MNSSNWKKLSPTLKSPSASPTPPPKDPTRKSENEIAIELALALTRNDRQLLPSDPEHLKLDRSDTSADKQGDEIDLLDALDSSEQVKPKDLLPTHQSEFGTSMHIPEMFRPSGQGPVPGTLLDWFTHLDKVEHPHGVSNETKTGTYVAIDCEMIGVGPDGIQSALARVSVVNFHGHVILDTYVSPQEPVTDYRTQFSGISRGDLDNAPSFAEVAKTVAELIKDRVLVGHDLSHDFRVLLLTHEKDKCRDTSYYPPLRAITNNRAPKLSVLTKSILGVTIQDGSHDSIDDARAAMLIFRLHRTAWDQWRLRSQNDSENGSESLRKRKTKSGAFWSNHKSLKKQRKRGKNTKNEGTEFPAKF